MEAIDRLVRDGVTTAVGHTDSDAAMIKEAVDRGATVATHLFNAMRPIHHREPGPVPALLDDPRVVVELIADGVHLHDDVLLLAIAAAGPDRVALITDAMLAAGASDGRYRLGALPVEVSEGRARLVKADGSPGAIAGSTLTMAAAYERLIGLGLPHEQVARMAATTPARVHRLNRVGAIEAGRLADLCVVDDRGALQRVMARGEWVGLAQGQAISGCRRSGRGPLGVRPHDRRSVPGNQRGPRRAPPRGRADARSAGRRAQGRSA